MAAMDTLADTQNLIVVLADRNRLAALVDSLEFERGNLAEMLDNLMIRLKDSNTTFEDEVEGILRLLPEVNLWWVNHQREKAELGEQRRIAALKKLTRSDAVALGVEEDWDDLAHLRHMEE